MSDGPPVLAAIDAGVMVVTLNRPHRLNASNRAMTLAFVAAIDRAAADAAVRAIVVTGAGRAFCAGADRAVLEEHAATPGRARSGSGGLPYAGLRTLAKPVIAAINGPCAGIGLSLACCCDMRFAAEDAIFLAPFASLGLPAEEGLAWHLQRLVGPGRAADILMSARRVAAAEAHAIGLADRLYPTASLLDETIAYARSLAARCAPASLAMIKHQLADAAGGDFDRARQQAADMTRTALHGADFAAAMAATTGDGRPAFAGLSCRFQYAARAAAADDRDEAGKGG